MAEKMSIGILAGGQGAIPAQEDRIVFKDETLLQTASNIGRENGMSNFTELFLHGQGLAFRTTAEVQGTTFLYQHLLYQKLLESGKLDNLQISGLLGISLGEYNALVIGGILTPEDALSLVFPRARAMAEACEQSSGIMRVIIGLPLEKIQEVVNPMPGVWISNLNTPNQIVISGETERVLEAGEKLSEIHDGVKVINPRTKGAFHTELMQSAIADYSPFAQKLTQTNFQKPNQNGPVISNVEAQDISDFSQAELIELLKKHIVSPVDLINGIQKVRKQVGAFLTFETGKVAEGIIKGNDGGVKVVRLNSLRDIDAFDPKDLMSEDPQKIFALRRIQKDTQIKIHSIVGADVFLPDMPDAETMFQKLLAGETILREVKASDFPALNIFESENEKGEKENPVAERFLADDRETSPRSKILPSKVAGVVDKKVLAERKISLPGAAKNEVRATWIHTGLLAADGALKQADFLDETGKVKKDWQDTMGAIGATGHGGAAVFEEANQGFIGTAINQVALKEIGILDTEGKIANWFIDALEAELAGQSSDSLSSEEFQEDFQRRLEIVKKMAKPLKTKLGAKRFFPGELASMLGSWLARDYGIKSLQLAPNAACASGLQGIYEAINAIENSEINSAVIASADEASESLTALAGFGHMGALSKKGALRSFDKDRDGFIMSEGGAGIVIVPKKIALEKEIQSFGDIIGVGKYNCINSDSITIGSIEGQGGAINEALVKAALNEGMSLEEFKKEFFEKGLIIPHGTGTGGDQVEAESYNFVFADGVPKVASYKPNFGHLLGAAGLVSVVVGTKIFEKSVVPQTINCENQDPNCKLEIIKENMRFNGKYILAFAAGFGGINYAVVLKNPNYQEGIQTFLPYETTQTS